jgi:hypothetical protein
MFYGEVIEYTIHGLKGKAPLPFLTMIERKSSHLNRPRRISYEVNRSFIALIARPFFAYYDIWALLVPYNSQLIASYLYPLNAIDDHQRSLIDDESLGPFANSLK